MREALRIQLNYCYIFPRRKIIGSSAIHYSSYSLNINIFVPLINQPVTVEIDLRVALDFENVHFFDCKWGQCLIVSFN